MRPGAAKRPGGPIGRPSGGPGGESALGTLLMLALLAIVAFAATYSVMSAVRGPAGGVDEATLAALDAESRELMGVEEQGAEAAPEEEGGEPRTCRGMNHFELWGEAVVWGVTNLVDTPQACCQQCKQRCESVDKCECNSWVYCGDKELCKDNYKQCWLKKQEDILKPEVHGTNTDVPWTSGLVHGPGQGIIALETEMGRIRIKLQPTWAPMTVHYVRELLQMKYCTGCQLYRAEGLGGGWNADGSRTSNLPGPPYALVQGTLQTDGLPFKPVPQEATPIVRRGYVCLVGEGPDFFISLADHTEWGHAHTVFGVVPEEDITDVLDKIVVLPTNEETWGETHVRALAVPLNFKVVRDSSGIMI